MEPFDTRSPAPSLALETDRRKKKKSKLIDSDLSDAVPVTVTGASKASKIRANPPPSDFAFPTPIVQASLPTDDQEMAEAETLEPNSEALRELQLNNQLVEQVLAEQEAAELAAAKRESERQYTAELMAVHAAREERSRLESTCGPTLKPRSSLPVPSGSPVRLREPVLPSMAADITSGKLIADVQAAEIHKRSVHEPQHNLPTEQQLADMEFHSFIPFFRAVQHAVMGKTWSPSIEAWVLRQVRADAQPARILRDALQLYEPDRSTRCYFPDLEHLHAFSFNVLFHGRHPVDVIERHAQKLRVRRNEADKGPTVTDSCAALAHAMRELVSYYPQNMRPPTELLMAKVKAKLPATVAAQLDNPEFLLNMTLTYEEFYETLNRADMSYGKSLESRGKPPAKRDQDTRGGNANGKRGRNSGGRGPRGRSDARPSTDKKPKVTCKYCKKPGHTVEECYTLKNKKEKEAKGGAKTLTHADLKSAIAEALAAHKTPADK